MIVITSRLENQETLKRNVGSSVEIACRAIDQVKPFYVTASEYMQPANFNKNSNLRIVRARLDFYGAHGLRPGMIQANTNFPAYAGLSYKLPINPPSSVDLILFIPVFNEWFNVGKILPVYGNDFEISMNDIRGWYDSVGIGEVYEGKIFEGVLSLEMDGVLL